MYLLIRMLPFLNIKYNNFILFFFVVIDALVVVVVGGGDGDDDGVACLFVCLYKYNIVSCILFNHC